MRREFEGHAAATAPAGSIGAGNRSDEFSWRLAAFYAAFFGFSGIIMPFFPVWLQAKGLLATPNSNQVGSMTFFILVPRLCLLTGLPCG